MHEQVVVVVAETPDYRRACVVHTCFGDSFLEIGCDYGPTVDRVQKALLQSDNHSPSTTDDQARTWCLGIDKSEKSIRIAKERWVHRHVKKQWSVRKLTDSRQDIQIVSSLWKMP